MNWAPIIPPDSAPPLAPYVPGTKVGNAVYVSGTLAIGAHGEIVGIDDPRAQTRHVLESIRKVLQAAGGDIKDVTYNMIFLKRGEDYAAMNEIYREFFGAAPPARFCIVAGLVKPEFLVEIASIAYLPAAQASSAAFA